MKEGGWRIGFSWLELLVTIPANADRPHISLSTPKCWPRPATGPTAFELSPPASRHPANREAHGGKKMAKAKTAEQISALRRRARQPPA